MRRITPAILLLLIVAVLLAGSPLPAQDPAQPMPAGPTVGFPQGLASGDPRDSSVILWTRAVDAAAPDADVPLQLTVAADRELNEVVVQRDLTASARHDHCVKVRVGGLQPGRFYWYRFSWSAGAGRSMTPIARTKTAPAADADVPVSLAITSCQDRVGRYYNSLALLLADHDEDIDAIVCLGDYIYERTADPAQPKAQLPRAITFREPGEAITVDDGLGPYQVARSLGNYRDLHRAYRTDPVLQRVHERWPLIAIWDDHEFSNDIWQSTGSEHLADNGAADTARRDAAAQAYFEYMPVDLGLNDDGLLDITAERLSPANAHLYREFSFGKQLQLLLTEYRSYRPDHLIAEDAFPPAIVIDAPTIDALPLPDAQKAAVKIDPYVNIDAPELATHKGALVAAFSMLYQKEGVPAEAAAARAQKAVAGNLGLLFINKVLAGINAGLVIDPAGKPRGVSYLAMGKQRLISDVGSRNIVNQDLYYLYANVVAMRGQSDDALGRMQGDWLRKTLSASQATWKLVGSSVVFTPLVLDLSNPRVGMTLPSAFPAMLRQRLIYSLDGWEGFPRRREALLNYFSTVPGAVLLSGDIHASFVTDHGDRHARPGGGPHRVIEFTGPPTSSRPLKSLLGGAVSQIGLPPGSMNTFVSRLGEMFMLSSVSAVASQPSQIAFADTDSSGVMVVTASATELRSTYTLLPSRLVSECYYDRLDDLRPHALNLTYTVPAPKR
ncbi:MAG: alkaline phosphatase [Planctomycetota bacterium]